ncbi:AraC family transcriptional regulator [Winogradskya humida]|uniref:AraC family transcriptional regulator n=1 Tax=Winogradskya humida TaxID=113566 RepID=A0ABQ3ZF03_9ACTN|nr:AraC family transcriptional regulator [Actinoplanes humidus]GIE17158.1 AraC family transcriptional regulator [Actinoplanes humidus]
MSLTELKTLITRHVRRDSATAIDGVLLSSVDVPGPPASSTTGTVFALIAQGQKRMSLGDRVLDYGAGQYLLASVDLPVTGHFSVAPALGFGLILRPAAIAALVLEAGLTGSRAPAPGLAVSDASPELIDAVVRMLRLLEQPRDRPVLAPMIEREILWRLITGDQGGTVRQLGLADSGLSHVSRAVQWIRDNHAEPFRVEDLARTAGMSVSAFHRTFLAVTAMSPIQFQKRIRLQQARLLLMGRPSDVAGAGLAVGYDSASQFSRDYRRLFGEPPGRDAARLTAGRV